MFRMGSFARNRLPVSRRVLQHNLPEAVIPVIPSSAAYPGSFGQPRFPKTLNEQLRPCLSAPGDQRKYCKGGIKLKHTHRRLTRLSVASEMGESGRETAVSYRKGGVVTLSFPSCDDGLVRIGGLRR